MSRRIRAEGFGLRLLNEKPLFSFQSAGPRSMYDVAPDGRFLVNMITPAGATTAPLAPIVMTDWLAVVRRR